VPVLKAATYNNYEVGGWVSFAATKGYAEVSLYKMDGENEVVSTRLADGSYLNQNAGRTSHKGVEISIKYAPVQDINIRLSGAYAQHKYIDYIEQGKDYSGNRMAQAPPFIYNGEVSLKPHYFKGFRIALELQGMNEYYTDPQNTATYKGFTVMNVRAGYSIKGVELWTNCMNACNKIFAAVVEKSAFGTSYRPGQLRTLNVGLAYQFNAGH
jgi:iron complex outermembrane receptor protein